MPLLRLPGLDLDGMMLVKMAEVKRRFLTVIPFAVTDLDRIGRT
jgi:hypothetical protein